MDYGKNSLQYFNHHLKNQSLEETLSKVDKSDARPLKITNYHQEFAIYKQNTKKQN